MSVPELADAPAAAAASPRSSGRGLTTAATAPAALVALLTLVGVAIRLVVAHESVFADELSTYWISATHGLGGVVSLLYGTGSIKHAEITPPLSFLASWLTTQIGHTALLLRAPSLIAGAASIPVVYLLGRRTVGRRPALVATALTTLSPFMIYYSTEARAYALMMLFVMVSTLAMLLAIDTGRTRWWVVYAVCSAAAFYAHYTSVFVLGAQLLWLLWVHPDAGRPAILANAGAVALVLPWTPGLINDFNSPTVDILSALSPFSLHDIWIILGHWTIGYPYSASTGLRSLPGTIALVLLGAAVIAALAGVAVRLLRGKFQIRLAHVDRRFLLILALALCTPVGEAIFSAFSTHVFGARNLAASWPPLALSFAALLFAAGPRLGVAAVVLAIASFAIGAAKMLNARFARPDYRAAADFIDRDARPGDVVIDRTGVLSPGPLTALDVALHRRLRVLRADTAAERGHPFGLSDPIVPLPEAIHGAVAAADGGRIFVVSSVSPGKLLGFATAATSNARFPPSYRLVETRRYTGFAGTVVEVYAKRTTPG